MERVLKLTISYDGTAYVGWQRQAAGVSIQGLIEDALGRLEGSPLVVHGAGRTDAGVHALAQVASVSVTTAHEPLVVRRALNAMLPGDVRVLLVEEAAPGFHARYHAAGKTYEYRIWQGDVQPPFARTWSWHVPRALDVAAMDRAARMLEGRHDFSAFQSAGSGVASAVRTMASARAGAREAGAEVSGEAGGDGAAAARGRLVIVRLEADGFLRHMVRAVVGTLVEVGAARRDAESLAALLASRDRAASGATAPAHGLVLVRVLYAGPPAAP
ncbi:MAG: tRNA pseudouridine(38-40) synthase TruA [Vicinamibacterales bacterium]